MYIVTAVHNGGHGEECALALATSDPRTAVETARNIEGLGFEFFGNETGVHIFKPEEGRYYPKGAYRNGTDPTAYVRLKVENEWREGWHDKELAALFNEPIRYFYEDVPVKA